MTSYSIHKHEFPFPIRPTAYLDCSWTVMRFQLRSSQKSHLARFPIIPMIQWQIEPVTSIYLIKTGFQKYARYALSYLQINIYLTKLYCYIIFVDKFCFQSLQRELAQADMSMLELLTRS